VRYAVLQFAVGGSTGADSVGGVMTPVSRLSVNPLRTLAAAAAAAAAAAFALALVVAPTPAEAAGVRPKAFPNLGVFGIKVNGTSQAFYAQASGVLSVSFQEYTTGPLYVSEVTVDMAGSNQLLRLFFSRPLSAADAQRHADGAAAGVGELTGGTVAPTAPQLPAEVATAVDNVGRAATKARAGLVVKTYPATTHAKTVDFAVSSREELESFYTSFRNLYVGIPISVNRQFAPVAASKANAGTNDILYINRIGGTLFTLE
jgi:hypothetical protein